MKRQILKSVLVLLAVAGFAGAATLNVPTGPYPTIQAAIDAAVDGVDEVVVSDGTYSGVGNYDLNFRGKAITVKSANGPANCIIDCQGQGRGFSFFNDEGAGSIVDGFTIKNGDADYGGGIDCYYASPTIINCVIRDNHADFDGGGVACYEGLPTIKNCLFLNNSTGYFGGAINCDGSSAIISNCTFSGNSASGDGGGVYCYYYASPQIINSIFENCSRHAIYEDDPTSDPVVSHCLFYNNPDGDYYDDDTAQSYTGASQVNSVVGNNTNLDGDPLFRTGPLGDYYLSQIAAGQLVDSNCINTGSGTASARGLASYTTATNNTLDSGIVDIGYHYTDTGVVAQYYLTTGVVGGNGSIVPDPNGSPHGPYDQFSEIAMAALPDVGYDVNEWEGADNVPAKGEVNNIVTITEDKTVTVKFKPRIVYQLTTIVVDGVGGTIDPNSGPQYEGDIVLLTATPGLGYAVKAWTGTDDDTSVGLNNYVTMDSDKTVTVEFTYNTVRLDTKVDANTPYGRIRPRSGYYPLDLLGVSPVQLLAIPDYGYRVKAWTGTDNDTLTTLENTITMTEDKSVTVEFESIAVYYLTTSVVGGNGSIAPPSGPYHDGEVVNLNATPDPNYEVKAWSETDDDTLTTTQNTVTISGSDAHVTVKFTLIPKAWVYKPNGTLRITTPFSTIQAAIGAALADDEVVVGDGVYTGSGNRDLHFNKGIPITIRSKNGPENCIIDCEGADRGFRFNIADDTIDRDTNDIVDINSIPNPNDFIVRGFTITNGSADFGGGLYYEGTVDERGSLTASFPAPLVDNCIITGNSATSSGGGVAFNVIVEDPNAPEVPADAPVPIITNCKIINNTTSLGSGANGGGIFCTNASPVIISTEISGNSGFNGGGIYCEAGEGGASEPAIINCLITGNTSVDIGGSIYLFDAPAIINLCTIACNTGLDYNDVDPDNANRPYGPKGGICSREADPVITNCIIWGNGDDLYECGATYSCIEDMIDSDEDDAESNVDEDPLFTRGGLGNFYLSQAQAGQGIDSPCKDTAEQYILSILQGPPPDGYNLEMDITTSIQNHLDIGYADMGYHYRHYDGPPILYDLHISATGPGVVDYYDDHGHHLGSVTEATSPVLRHFLPGTEIHLTANATNPNSYRGTWHGTDEDTSTNTWNTVSMYNDRNVTVDFEPILRRKLHVPQDYPLLQDAIDAAKYKDEIVLARGGIDDPYYTSQGFLVSNKAITIRSVEPNDPACVAATVISLEIGPEGYLDITGFRFHSVGPDTILAGITIKGFNTLGGDGLDGDPSRNWWDGVPGQPIYGAAIQCVNASPTIKNCVIRDCNAVGGDGGDGASPSEPHMPDGGHGGWPGRGYGGGLACLYNSNPTVINCTFDNCSAIGGGGGDGAQGNTDPTDYGEGGRGGGWYYSTHPSTPYEWSGNQSHAYLHNPNNYDFYTEYSGRGGAVYVGTGCSPTFTDCTFTNNRTEGGLSGICGQDGWPPEGRKRPSLHWKIDNFGGAVFCDANSSARFTNCEFTDNVASPNRPTRDYNEPYDPVTNYDNDDLVVGYGGAVAFKNNANVTLENCTFNDNSGDEGGAVYWTWSDPVISDCNFSGNSAQSGGAVLFAGGLGGITRSNFSGNEAVGASGRGGAICSLGANAFISDCNMSNNQASSSGGGIYVSSRDVDGNDLIIDGENVLGWNAAVLLNCLITNNTAGEDGGGISVTRDSEPNIINCTIAENTVIATGYGGGLYGSYGSHTNVINSIIWGNEAQNGTQIGVGISASPSTVDVSFSDVQGAQTGAYVEAGCILNWDANNLYTDPLFVSGPLGDYYLSQIDAGQSQPSPCVDAGSGLASHLGMNLYTTQTNQVFDRGTVDMGYHYPFTSMAELCRFCDLLYDSIINFRDFARLVSNWSVGGCSSNNDWCLGADLTFDTYVNLDDVVLFAECWLVSDTSAPLPSPSEWAVEPYSSSTTAPYSISMTAETAFDNWSGDVEYYFECVYGDGNDSNWQADPNYTDDIDLEPDTEYGYKVMARDTSVKKNETDWSVIRYAITGEGGGGGEVGREYYAVICGIADYQGAENDLIYTINDAYSLYQILIESGNWEEGNITMLLDSSATKAAIQGAIENMASRLDYDDVFLFYFSGHGTAGPEVEPFDELDGYDEYLVTYDLAEVGSEEYINFQDLLRDDELAEWLGELPTENRLVLLDSCNSGGAARGLSAKGLGDNVPSQGDGFGEDLLRIALPQNQGGVVLTACAEDELSYETYELGHGVFTYYLLDAMYGRGDDEGNGNGWLSAEESYDYLVNRVNSYMERFGVIDGQYGQHPQLYDADLVNEFEFLSLEMVSPAAPAAPSNLQAAAVSSYQIDLSWTDNSDNEEHFRIDRKTVGGMFEQIAAVGPSQTSYSDSWLVPETTYTYRIRAHNEAGDSAWSTEASATTFPEGPLPDTTPPAPVMWDPNAINGGLPYMTGSGLNCYANMTAAEATDPEGNGVEYYFECTEVPSLNSGWTTERVWNNIYIGNGAIGFHFHFRVRDLSPNYNQSNWSTTVICLPFF